MNAKPKTKIGRETVFIVISVILSLGVISGVISCLGFVATEITDAFNQNLTGASQPVKFDLQGYKNLGIGQ